MEEKLQCGDLKTSLDHSYAGHFFAPHVTNASKSQRRCFLKIIAWIDMR